MAARSNQAHSPTAHLKCLDGEVIITDLTAMVSGDKHAKQSIVDLFLMLYNKIEAHEIEAENTAQICLDTNRKLALLELEMKYLKNENDLLKHNLSLTEDSTRSMYLRLEGLNENFYQQFAFERGKSSLQNGGLLYGERFGPRQAYR